MVSYTPWKMSPREALRGFMAAPPRHRPVWRPDELAPAPTPCVGAGLPMPHRDFLWARVAGACCAGFHVSGRCRQGSHPSNVRGVLLCAVQKRAIYKGGDRVAEKYLEAILAFYGPTDGNPNGQKGQRDEKPNRPHHAGPWCYSGGRCLGFRNIPR